MKTAVDAIFVGKERKFNRRFEQLVSHHLVEPTACTPASGWEKGQVENQVGVLLELTLPPRADCARYDSLRAPPAPALMGQATTAESVHGAL